MGGKVIVTVRTLPEFGKVLGLAILLISGCVLSVDPVISESGATFNPRLLGAWEEVSGPGRAVVSRAAQNRYAIDYTSDGTTGRFEARLGRPGDRLVLDVWPHRATPISCSRTLAS